MSKLKQKEHMVDKTKKPDGELNIEAVVPGIIYADYMK